MEIDQLRMKWLKERVAKEDYWKEVEKVPTYGNVTLDPDEEVACKVSSKFSCFPKVSREEV